MESAQAELDFTRTHVRRGDPGTSVLAAESMKGAAARQCAAILSEIVAAGRPLAAEEIADRLNMTTHAVGKRMSDLERETSERTGLIRKSNQHHRNRSGRWAVKWEAC